MRLPVSLLVLCAGITGCTTSVDPALVDTISVTSNPTSAAVRLNGIAVGRTPNTDSLNLAVATGIMVYAVTDAA